MKSAKKLSKRLLEKAAISAAKAAAGSASTNMFHQTSEPKNLRKLLSK
ncbi:MAG: cyclic lactone autoinducer peptide [Ruminococcus sp.]|nr:cyclic lactone autoinducer peptide [Ruminococcus sp.]